MNRSCPMRAKSACAGLNTKFDSIRLTAMLGTRKTAERASRTQVSPKACEAGISIHGADSMARLSGIVMRVRNEEEFCDHRNEPTSQAPRGWRALPRRSRGCQRSASGPAGKSSRGVENVMRCRMRGKHSSRLSRKSRIQSAQQCLNCSATGFGAQSEMGVAPVVRGGTR